MAAAVAQERLVEVEVDESVVADRRPEIRVFLIWSTLHVKAVM